MEKNSINEKYCDFHVKKSNYLLLEKRQNI